jgi:hypothetical protein
MMPAALRMKRIVRVSERPDDAVATDAPKLPGKDEDIAVP